MAWLLAGLRRWREDRATSLLVALLVLASALVFGLAPRLLDRIGHAALRSTAEALAQDARGIELLQIGRIDPSAPDPLAGVAARGAELEASVPATVRDLVDARSFVLDTPRYEAEDQQGATIAIATLRIQPGALAHVRIASGRAPAAGSRTLPDPTSGRPRTVYEVAISEATAAALDVGVGDTISLGADAHDPLATRFPIPAAAEVVGIFRVTDPRDPFWFGDTALATPGIRAYSAELQFVDATLLLSPDAYPRLFAATRDPFDFRATWRLDVDPARVAASPPDALVGDLRRLATVFPAVSQPDGVEVRTQLTQVVGAHLARWQSASLILAVAGAGTATVGIAALGLVALLAARRRRPTIAAWLARGASRGQVLAGSLAEAALVALPPALLAGIVALIAVPDAGPPATSAILCAVVAAVAIALLVGADLAAAGAGAGPSPAARAGGRGTRRVVAEATVIVVAVAGALLVRQRAAPLAGAGPGALEAPDPFIAAVPALVGIAAGLLAARLFPLPMRVLGSIAARGRGLVPVLALRRSTRGGTAAAMLLVLMATTTIATFGAATLAHLDQAASAIAWQTVGADLHVSAESTGIPAGVRLTDVPGVTAVADVYRAAVPLGVHGASVELLAVDPAAFERVTVGTPAEQPAFAALSRRNGEPLPAIVSPGLSDQVSGIAVGDTFGVFVGGETADLVAVGTLETAPTIPLDGGAFVIVSRPLLEAAIGGTLRTTDALVRAPGVTAAALRAAIAPRLPGVAVTGRAETEAAIRHSPIVDGAAAGVVLAALVAAAYAAIALVAALALASGARAAESAHLRTLGLSDRQSAGLVAIEHLPAIVVAFVAGVLLGAATFALAEPGLGLDALLGSSLSVALRIDPPALVALLAAAAVPTAVGLAVGVALERSASPATSLRRGLG